MNWTVETLIPVVLLATLAGALPWALLRNFPRSQRSLALALAGSSLVLCVAGGVLFAGLYLLGGLPTEALTDAPLSNALYFLRLGLSSAIVWLPILLLSGFALAQRIEAEKGAALAARPKD